MMCRNHCTTIRRLLSILALAWMGAASAQDMSSPALKRMAETGNVFLAHREAAVPFSYMLPDGTPTGYSWDVCLGVVKALEQKLGRTLNVVPVFATPNGRLMMVRTGMADMECGATTHTRGREKLVSFSNTFFVAQVRGMVRANSNIHSLGDLMGKRVVSTGGTTADRLIKMATMQRSVAIEQSVGGTNLESMDMLASGNADMFVADDAILAAQRASATQGGEDFVLLDESLSFEPYGIVLPMEDREFKMVVDDALVQMMQSGEMQQVYDKWFTQPIPPKGANLNLPMPDVLKEVIAAPNDRAIN